MLDEVLDFLNIQPDHWYLDCNLGGGGHTDAILECGGKVIGLDIDPEAIREVGKNHDLTIQTTDDHLEAYSDNLILFQSNFISLTSVVTSLQPLTSNQSISGILFDLGVSSYQLETADRGFSFSTNAPLDMRMDQSIAVSAADLVNGLHESELTQLFLKLGEENFAKPISKKIVQYRQTTKIETTDQLANIILSVRHKSKTDRTHPATRVFQALRIAVNDELNSLKEALPLAFDILSPGGRLVVISFHSLEDRIVKNFFKQKVGENLAKPITKKPTTPTEKEVFNNPRSRSGKLRIIEKF